jgi:DNA-binding transcriptional MerR regulator
MLTIGEFAAATQLSPKALRLYDEQRLIPPAHIDATNGYRYYRSAQVRIGRLIRVLREMGLTLAEISRIVTADDLNAEKFLSRFAREQDYRHAREKRAFYSALVMLRQGASSSGPVVVERARPEHTVAVHEFSANRNEFVERFRFEVQNLLLTLANAGMSSTAPACCALVDPLSDEEGQLEVMVPVKTNPSDKAIVRVEELASPPSNVSFRLRPAARCASVAVEHPRTHAADFSSALDALFDWFDRHAYHAIDSPTVSIGDADNLPTEIEWAYE